MGRKVGRRDVLKVGLGLGSAGVGFASGLVDMPKAIAAGEKPEPVNLINSSGTTSLLWNVMFEELGLFKKYGVEVNITNVSDGSKILAALIGGTGDMCGGSGFGGLFPAIQKGAKIKVVCGANIAPLNVIFAHNSHPEIKSVEDLPGHTVGTGQIGALLHILAVAVMKKYNVDYTKVNFVNVGSSTSVFKALVGGTVEAGVAPLQYRDTADKYNLHPVLHGEFYTELPLFTNQAMYATDKAIAEKRDGLIRVMAAHAELYRWIGKPENKEAFRTYYKKALGAKAKDNEIEFTWDFLGQPGRIARGLVLTEEQIDYVQDLNIQVGIQKEKVPLKDAVDMSMAEEALKLVTS